MDSTSSEKYHAAIRPLINNLSPEEETYLEGLLTSERLEKLNNVLDKRRNDIIPVCYSLYDPFNIGAILRTAESFGLQENILIDERPHNHCPKCVTKGCEKWLTIKRYNNYLNCAEDLHQRGYQLLVADMDGESLDQVTLSEKIAIIVGSEHDGVPHHVRQSADNIVSIPMRGFSQSMNVSVSMAIILSNILARKGFHNKGTLSDEERHYLHQHWLLKAIPHSTELIQRLRNKG